MNNAVILIPSRLAATRLPKKPLLKINNISIINHVYKIANSSIVGQSYVATGDKEIFHEVTKYGGKCILTQSDHKTGTDRIFEAFQKLDNDFEDREDKDIDNDGDTDSSDEYLKKRRAAVSKAIKKQKNEAAGYVDIPALGDFVKGK